MSTVPARQKTLPTEMANHCLSFRVRLLNRKISRIYDEALRPYGLTSSQLNLLLAVAAFGPVESPDVAAALGMEKSTLSRHLGRLRKRGLVESTPSGHGSGRLLSASDDCYRLLHELEPAWREAQRSTQELLGKRDAKAVSAAANRLWTVAADGG